MVTDLDDATASGAADAMAVELGETRIEQWLGWRIATINATLHDWGAAHAGRADLEWCHDPLVHTPMVDVLRDRVLEKEEHGEGGAVGSEHPRWVLRR